MIAHQKCRNYVIFQQVLAVFDAKMAFAGGLPAKLRNRITKDPAKRVRPVMQDPSLRSG